MQPGQLDLFDGSPPCASFSTAGKREAGWGKVKEAASELARRLAAAAASRAACFKHLGCTPTNFLGVFKEKVVCPKVFAANTFRLYAAN